MLDQDEDEDEGLQGQNDEGAPEVIFVSVVAAKEVVDIVLGRAGSGQDERDALARRLTSKSLPVDSQKMPEIVAKTRRKRVHRIEELRQIWETRKRAGEDVGEFDPNDDPEKDFQDGGDGKDGEKEVVRCVEAGGLLRGLLQEYREEQAHRRAAIRLMFQTATNPGADDDDAEDDDDAAAKPEAQVDMQQFISMCESLNSKISIHFIVSLYRDAHEIGNGKVTFDSFMKAAEMRQFFSDCLRLPSFVGAAQPPLLSVAEDKLLLPDNLSAQAPKMMSEASRAMLAAVVSRHAKLFEQTITAAGESLTGLSRTRLSSLLSALNQDLDKAGSGPAPDGRRPLCAYRRVLDLLIYSRMERREASGELTPRVTTADAAGTAAVDYADRELSARGSIVRIEVDPATPVYAHDPLYLINTAAAMVANQVVLERGRHCA